MKRTYHLCLSGGEEILFRDTEDYNRGFNCLAIALYKSNSSGLVESFMSNHVHLLVQTENPAELMYHFRMHYSMYFNRKYSRKGKLGEKIHFTMEVVGYHHMIAAASYVLRNALHHGVVPIPYAYPHCSVNSIFMKEMGKRPEDRLLHRRYHRRYLGKTAEYPDRYRMNENGLFLRDSVLDIPQVENLFVTPRSFNYYMSRKSSEEWEEEQMKDNNMFPVVNIENIEKGVIADNTRQMLIWENGKADYKKPSDIDICMEIDRKLLPLLGKSSVYLLTEREKVLIAEHIYRDHHINEKQIRRCLAIGLSL